MTARRRRNDAGRTPTFELVVAAVVVALLIAMAVVFLFVYHDFPLRIGGP